MMKNSVTITAELHRLNETAQHLTELFGDKKVVAFYGEMGSGKTTVIKALCQFMNCIDNVSSPTFSIINEYATSDGNTIYHFDFYRLNNLKEALDVGVEEYLYSGNFCFMEWSERIEALLPENHIKVIISSGIMPNSRILQIEQSN
jgi:tRNA threonylcarbamoyladenosine biosynthesis protein TsaE